MTGIDVSTIRTWQAFDHKWLPVAIDTSCPRCGRAVSLSLSDPSWDVARRTIATSSSCPSCHLTFNVWIIEPNAVSSDQGFGDVVLYPPPGRARNPMYGSEYLPERVLALYRQALCVYNAKLWNVAVGCCRQTFEVTARTLLPAYEVQESISSNMLRLSNSIQPKKPILDIAFLIRDGGRLLPYLAQTKEPNEETAGVILNLCECLLQYVFALPLEAASVRQRVEGIANPGRVRRVG